MCDDLFQDLPHVFDLLTGQLLTNSNEPCESQATISRIRLTLAQKISKSPTGCPTSESARLLQT